jgi:YggT family protein
VIFFVIDLINIISRLIFLLVLGHVIMSYFMSPFHPIRQTIDRFVEPMLAPIRKVVPPIGMIDFSPLILLLLIQLVSWLIRSLLLSFV